VVGIGADDVSALKEKCYLSDIEEGSTDFVLLAIVLRKGITMFKTSLAEVNLIRGLYLNFDQPVSS
jgi:hypothetical protein